MLLPAPLLANPWGGLGQPAGERVAKRAAAPVCPSPRAGRYSGAAQLPSGIASPHDRPSGPAAGEVSSFLPQCSGRLLAPAQEGGEVVSAPPRGYPQPLESQPTPEGAP